MTGNKFYLMDRSCLDRLSKLSPWGLPEQFNENNAENFQRQGVILKCTSDHRVGWVYGRWGRNLSVADKSPYNTEVFQEIEFSSSDDLLANIDTRIEHPEIAQFPDMTVDPRVLEVRARRSGSQFEVDSNLADITVPWDEIRVVLRDPQRNDETFKFTTAGPWTVESDKDDLVVLLYAYSKGETVLGAFTRERFPFTG